MALIGQLFSQLGSVKEIGGNTLVRTKGLQDYSEVELLVRSGVEANQSALVLATTGANTTAAGLFYHECGGRLAVISRSRTVRGGHDGAVLTPFQSTVDYADSPNAPFEIGQTGIVRGVYALQIDQQGNVHVSAPIAWIGLPLENARVSDINYNGAMEWLMKKRGAASTRELFGPKKQKLSVFVNPAIPRNYGLDLPTDMQYFANLVAADHGKLEVTLG